MNTYIYRIRHNPTGLFYSSRQGRFDDDITNLTGKGNIYTSEKAVKKVYEESCGNARINHAQVARDDSPARIVDGPYGIYYQCYRSDFEIIKYEILEVVE